jgi:hypothetical protein
VSDDILGNAMLTCWSRGDSGVDEPVGAGGGCRGRLLADPVLGVAFLNAV